MMGIILPFGSGSVSNVLFKVNVWVFWPCRAQTARTCIANTTTQVLAHSGKIIINTDNNLNE
jgi:hypothetical protein